MMATPAKELSPMQDLYLQLNYAVSAGDLQRVQNVLRSLYEKMNPDYKVKVPNIQLDSKRLQRLQRASVEAFLTGEVSSNRAAHKKQQMVTRSQRRQMRKNYHL
jgi:uncharacterized membrane-anchored protein